MTEAAGAGCLSIVFLLLWTFRFTPSWVRIPADGYAQQLAESVDELGVKKPAAKAAKKSATS
jgi:hypothetical protein